MYQPLCLCAEVPKLALKTQVVILMHTRERKLTTNTAKLARLALSRCEIQYRGVPGEKFSAENSMARGSSAALLYPSEDSVVLTPEWAKANADVTLFVPDGSWRQARKVAFREQSLEKIPRLRLPPGAPSSYRLRRSTQAERLCTFEAISRALGILEGRCVQEKLDWVFLKMVERVLWSRGKLRPEQALTGIPERAILASHWAGIAGGALPRSLKNPSPLG